MLNDSPYYNNRYAIFFVIGGILLAWFFKRYWAPRITKQAVADAIAKSNLPMNEVRNRVHEKIGALGQGAFTRPAFGTASKDFGPETLAFFSSYDSIKLPRGGQIVAPQIAKAETFAGAEYIRIGETPDSAYYLCKGQDTMYLRELDGPDAVPEEEADNVFRVMLFLLE